MKTYRIDYIDHSTNKPVLSMRVGAKNLTAAKLKGNNYFQRHLRTTPKVAMLVKEL